MSDTSLHTTNKQIAVPGVVGDGAEPSGEVPPGKKRPPEQREAVIYLPSILHHSTGESVDTVALRMARALGRNCSDGRVSFTVAEPQTESYGSGVVRTAGIVREQGQKKETVLDVYEFDYVGLMIKRFARMPPVFQALKIAGVLTLSIPNLFLSIFRRGQSLRQKLQVAYAGGLVGVLLAYLLLLGLTAWATAEKALGEDTNGRIPATVERSAPAAGQETAAPLPPAVPGVPASQAGPGDAVTPPTEGGLPASAAPAATQRTQPVMSPTTEPVPPAPSGVRPREGRWWENAPGAAPVTRFLAAVATGLLEVFGVLLATIFAGLMALLNALGSAGSGLLAWVRLQLPWLQTGILSITVLGFAFRFNLKEFLTRWATETTCASTYLAFGNRRNQILGHLAELLQHLGSKPGVDYQKVHLVGYSFGSIVAMDALFQDSEVSRTYGRLSNLVTIGCPYDFVRTFCRADYFTGRYRWEERDVQSDSSAPPQPPTVPQSWINVYSPADLLASNFVDGGVLGVGSEEGYAAQGSLSGRKGHGVQFRHVAEAPPEERLPDEHVPFGPPAPRSWLEWGFALVLMKGFEAHSSYWERDAAAADKTCFDPIMKRLCPNLVASGDRSRTRPGN
jgi:pimeloyl-ACP methyl ester carboxylesterase